MERLEGKISDCREQIRRLNEKNLENLDAVKDMKDNLKKFRTRQATSNNFRRQLEAQESMLTDAPSADRDGSPELEEGMQEVRNKIRDIGNKLTALPHNYAGKDALKAVQTDLKASIDEQRARQ